jgi:hypothetical protein
MSPEELSRVPLGSKLKLNVTIWDWDPGEIVILRMLFADPVSQRWQAIVSTECRPDQRMFISADEVDPLPSQRLMEEARK